MLCKWDFKIFSFLPCLPPSLPSTFCFLSSFPFLFSSLPHFLFSFLPLFFYAFISAVVEQVGNMQNHFFLQPGSFRKVEFFKQEDTLISDFISFLEMVTISNVNTVSNRTFSYPNKNPEKKFYLAVKIIKGKEHICFG